VPFGEHIFGGRGEGPGAPAGTGDQVLSTLDTAHAVTTAHLDTAHAHLFAGAEPPRAYGRFRMLAHCASDFQTARTERMNQRFQVGWLCAACRLPRGQPGRPGSPRRKSTPGPRRPSSEEIDRSLLVTKEWAATEVICDQLSSPVPHDGVKGFKDYPNTIHGRFDSQPRWSPFFCQVPVLGLSRR
jgi:hypothetical protein